MRFPSLLASIAAAALFVSTTAYADEPGSPSAPEPKLGDRGVVKLHIESSKPVQLFEHAAPRVVGIGAYAPGIESSTLLCTSPCDRLIDARAGQGFSARGDFPGVKSFTLHGFKDSASLDVNPGSNAMRIGGIVATTLGGAGVVAGSSLLLLSSTVNSGESCCSGGGGKTVSIAVLVSGSVALVGGIILLATSGTSWNLHATAPAKQAKARFWLGEF